MLTRNDLYDMTYVLICVRNHIECEMNVKVLQQIENVINNLYVCDSPDNRIRRALAELNLQEKKWEFVYHENFYVQRQFLKNGEIYAILKKMCNCLIQLLEKKQYVQAYDLADAFHCLPDVIANSSFTIPKSYWKIYIYAYRKKWAPKFLFEEEKKIKKMQSV